MIGNFVKSFVNSVWYSSTVLFFGLGILATLLSIASNAPLICAIPGLIFLAISALEFWIFISEYIWFFGAELQEKKQSNPEVIKPAIRQDWFYAWNNSSNRWGLSKELRKTQDARDNRIFEDLLSIIELYKTDIAKRLHNDYIDSEFDDKIREIFEKCIDLLKQSINLYKTRVKTKNKDIKKQVEKLRVKYVDEVEDIVEKLSESIIGINKLAIAEDTESDTIRRELEASLKQTLLAKQRADEFLAPIDDLLKG